MLLIELRDRIMASERLRKTALNAIASMVNLAVSGLAGLVTMRFILLYLGSDYNGLNSVTSQIMTLLLVVSSSFTIASLVALYKPYNENDWALLNKIMATSRRAYHTIGLVMILVGTVVCMIYALTIRSDVALSVIVIVLLLSLVSAVFNVSVVNSYRLIYQVSQTEYIVTFITAAYTLIASIASCFAVVWTENFIIVRLCYVIPEIISGSIIAIIARRRFARLNLTGKEIDYSLIKGTKDVLATSITGVVYQSAPTIFLASFAGTTATSIYYVYYSVVTLIRNIIQALIDSPRNAFGQIIHKNDKELTVNVFNQYEYITVFVTALLLACVLGLIMPFVTIYTTGVSGPSYQDPWIAFLLVLVAFIEAIHIPSGLAIQLSGSFKLLKHIQYSALILLVVGLCFGGVIANLYGILCAILATALALTFMEVYFARHKILGCSVAQFIRVSIPFFVLMLILGVIGSWCTFNLVNSVISFIGGCVIVLLANTTVFTVFSLLFYRKESKLMITMIKDLLRHRY